MLLFAASRPASTRHFSSLLKCEYLGRFEKRRQSVDAAYMSVCATNTPQAKPDSRIASPAPRKFGSRISEYLRDNSTPSAPALNAARTAPRVPSGVDLLELCAVGISISIPGHNCVFVPLRASFARLASRYT